MNLLIKNGTLVSSAGTMTADLFVEDGRISAAGRDSGYGKADRVIDAAGMFILPGGVDPHVHNIAPAFPAPGQYQGLCH